MSERKSHKHKCPVCKQIRVCDRDNCHLRANVDSICDGCWASTDTYKILNPS